MTLGRSQPPPAVWLALLQRRSRKRSGAAATGAPVAAVVEARVGVRVGRVGGWALTSWQSPRHGSHCRNTWHCRRRSNRHPSLPSRCHSREGSPGLHRPRLLPVRGRHRRSSLLRRRHSRISHSFRSLCSLRLRRLPRGATRLRPQRAPPRSPCRAPFHTHPSTASWARRSAHPCRPPHRRRMPPPPPPPPPPPLSPPLQTYAARAA